MEPGTVPACDAECGRGARRDGCYVGLAKNKYRIAWGIAAAWALGIAGRLAGAKNANAGSPATKKKNG